MDYVRNLKHNPIARKVKLAHDVVQIEVAIVGIIVNRVHKNSLQFLLIKSETATNDCTESVIISSTFPCFQDIS